MKYTNIKKKDIKGNFKVNIDRRKKTYPYTLLEQEDLRQKVMIVGTITKDILDGKYDNIFPEFKRTKK